MAKSKWINNKKEQEMANPFETIPGDRGKPEKMPCEVCDGTGKDAKGNNCKVCGGTGKAS